MFLKKAFIIMLTYIRLKTIKSVLTGETPCNFNLLIKLMMVSTVKKVFIFQYTIGLDLVLKFHEVRSFVFFLLQGMQYNAWN